MILQRLGESLSMKAKTRWYNEGKRSNNCFLHLLKRNNESSEMSKLNINGIVKIIYMHPLHWMRCGTQSSQ